MKRFKFYLFVTFIFVEITSCKKDHVVPQTPSFDYFPTEKGTYVVYDVDSIFHADNDNNTDDSVYVTHLQLKEVIDDTFLDGQGRPTQIIKRYRRSEDSLEWNELGVFTQVLASTGAYRTEENIPYHKLAFPISDQTSWNGNDANMLTEEIYQYQSFHVPLNLNSLVFDSTLSVLQVDDTNYIEKIYGIETYANHVGLIYKERDDLHKVNGLVVKGTEFRMKATSFGKE